VPLNLNNIGVLKFHDLTNTVVFEADYDEIELSNMVMTSFQ